MLPSYRGTYISLLKWWLFSLIISGRKRVVFVPFRLNGCQPVWSGKMSMGAGIPPFALVRDWENLFLTTSKKGCGLSFFVFHAMRQPASVTGCCMAFFLKECMFLKNICRCVSYNGFGWSI